MKRILSFCLAVLMCGCLFGCAPKQQKFQYQFFDTFDTIIRVVGFAKTQEEFDGYAQYAHDRFRRLNNLFDKFEDHGLTNGIAAVNAMAGVEPIKVDPQVMELILFSMEWQQKTDGAVDITMGPLISVWQDYIARYSPENENAKLPSGQELEDAAQLCGTHLLEIDQQAGTVWLKEKGASLDVGAVAKGYATELVAQELQQMGWESFSISSGGNVRTCGQPKNGNDYWNIGIQNPASGAVLAEQSELLDVVSVNDSSVVTSGDYQRYYMVGEKRVHHIIDPVTLMPADHYCSVTVVTPHSGQADLFSTALFVMDLESGKQLAEQYDLGVLWVMSDGSIQCSNAILPMLRGDSLEQK
ncbi:MAG: FAD:protein FMN transferase [Oscillospiraceae bacterium]|nr:FAD:protein FMN transferase [Oscillospiraceae bacterium]